MSEKITLYVSDSSEQNHAVNRKLAVEAALEVIRAAALGGLGSNLHFEFENLPSYADWIQRALESPSNRRSSS